MLHKESIWCHSSLDPWSLLGRGVRSAGETDGDYRLNVRGGMRLCVCRLSHVGLRVGQLAVGAPLLLLNQRLNGVIGMDCVAHSCMQIAHKFLKQLSLSHSPSSLLPSLPPLSLSLSLSLNG